MKQTQFSETTISRVERNKLLETPKALVKNVYCGKEYQTAILGNESHPLVPHLKTFIAVTTVNRLTAQLWLNVYEEKTKDNKAFPEFKGKVNWLVMIGNFRRDMDERLKDLSQALDSTTLK